LRQWLGTATAPAEPAPVVVEAADDEPPPADVPTALRRAMPLLAAGGLALLAAVVLWLRVH
jgi:hypothetical protein